MAGGFIVGLVIAVVLSIKGEAFPWAILMKAAIVGILAGAVFVIGSQFSKK